MTQGYTTYGMQSFDMSLLHLVQQQLITVQSAMENASNPGDLKLRLQGVQGSDQARYDEYDQGQKKKKKPGGGEGGEGGGAPFDNLLERFSE